MAGDALVPWGCIAILRMTDRGGRSPKTNERKTLACALSAFLRTMTCEKQGQKAKHVWLKPIWLKWLKDELLFFFLHDAPRLMNGLGKRERWL